MSVVGNLLLKLSRRKDGEDDESKGSVPRSGVSYGEFVSSACHYGVDTLLNKGGELVQIIKIEDYLCNEGAAVIRDAIRSSITRVVDPGISFWIYTVREKREFELDWLETQDFSDVLHHEYSSFISEKYDTYGNDLYIAVVAGHLREGWNGLLGALSFGRVKKKHSAFLATRSKQLSEITNSMIEDLQSFGARKLGLVGCESGKWRSELLEFLAYLVTCKRRECFLETCDNAYTLTSGYGFNVGFNAFRISDTDEAKYGAVLNIKEYSGDFLDPLDACLQQECEFIIVEIIQFVANKEIKRAYREQAELLGISGDTDLLRMGRLDDTMSINDDAFGDVCRRRINCVVLADNLLSLNRSIGKMVSSFSTLGVIVTRMDLAMEDSFWANMPGNFRYVLGMRLSLVREACTFAITHHFPSGAIRGKRWSEAITIFFSVKNLPYFFNFHVMEKGHTMCLGPQDSSMVSLLNFILSESRRLSVKSVVFDYSGKSIIFSNAIKGKYHRIDYGPESVTDSFNPFGVPDNEANRAMVLGILKRMVSPLAKPDQDTEAIIPSVVDKIFSIPIEERTQSKISECIGVLGSKARNWMVGGKFSHLIRDKTNIDWDSKFLAINAGMLVSKPECMSVVLYYLLLSLEHKLDGSPTILVMYEAWILDMVFLTEAEFDEWMNKMQRLNVVVVFATENTRAIFSSKVIRYAAKHVETRIFMPNFMISNKQHAKILGLSPKEVDTMLQISQNEGHFFIKQGDTSVVLMLKLHEREKRVLSASRATIKRMYEAVTERGEDWLPAFHEKCDKQLQEGQ